MLYQFELTTYCNLDCFYCPVETLKKDHMNFKLFCSLIDKIKDKSYVKLQGTGKAMLHPEFDKFMLYAKQKGHYVDIITNGTIYITNKKIKNLDKIGFSIDTLDEKLANKHGRKNLNKNLKNLLITHKKAPTKCVIYSVYYGQDLSQLKDFSLKYKIPHTIQNIQQKTSYQNKYKTNMHNYVKYECSYINQNKMNYYFVNGTLAPCPFMIDVKNVQSKEKIVDMFSKSTIPKCCEQCEELTGKDRLKKRIYNIKKL